MATTTVWNEYGQRVKTTSGKRRTTSGTGKKTFSLYNESGLKTGTVSARNLSEATAKARSKGAHSRSNNTDKKD